jgi:uncharacterized protein (UPF0332 family)
MTKPESADYLNRAQRLWKQARTIAAIELPDVAGRTAYLAAYHTAQAFIFDRTGKVTKSHDGARSEFARLAKDDPRIDRSFTAFLTQAYTLQGLRHFPCKYEPLWNPNTRKTLRDLARRLLENYFAKKYGDITMCFQFCYCRDADPMNTLQDSM